MWRGAAAICINQDNKLLMVLQGAKHEGLKWAVPSGGIEGNESFEECCIREVKEERVYSRNYQKTI